MRMKRILALMLALVFAMTGAFAYAEEDVEEESPAMLSFLEIALTRPEKDEPVHVTVGNTTKVSGQFFTSQFGNNTSDIDVRTMICGYSPVVWDNQLQFVTDPTVVESIAYQDGAEGRTYTVTLRDGLTYCDGTAITAADYVFGILLSASPQLTAIGANSGTRTSVIGYEAYSAGETNVFGGVRLLGERSYSLTVKQEYEPYFYELAYLRDYPYPIGEIAPGCTVMDDGQGAYIDGPFTAELLRASVLDPETGYMSHPRVTSGPYRLTGYDRESGRVDFAINPYYAGNHEGVTPWIDEVTLVPVSPQTMVEQLANGEVTTINKAVDQSALLAGMELSRTGAVNAVNYARLGYGFCALACEQGPQQFQAVRQALAYAFDTEEFVRTVFGGFALPVYGYYGIGQWMYGAVQGTIQLMTEDEEQAELFESLTLDGLNLYAFDLEAARALLEADGWTLNENGEAYNETVDRVRYKDVDGERMALSFDFARCIGNDTADEVVKRLQESLPQIGAELVVHDVPFGELLADYYRENGERKYDMNFMATNFVSVFDPYTVFAAGENYSGAMNTSGLIDEELIGKAFDLITTQPLDVLTYLQRWVAMQERFNEVLPTLPIYSNVYMDFSDAHLLNYYPNSEYSWPVALLYAYWGEPPTMEIGQLSEDELAALGEDDFDLEFDDDFEWEFDD